MSMNERLRTLAGLDLSDSDISKLKSSSIAAPFVLVAGMHRSGTSLVAMMLHALGVFMGPNSSFMKPMEDNPVGFYENRNIMKCSREMLDFSNTPRDFNDMEKFGYLVRRMEKQLLLDYPDKNKTCGFKDPRLCLTLPTFVEAFSKAFESRKLLIVKVYRDIDEIAMSLSRRHKSFDDRFARRIAHLYLESLEINIDKLDLSPKTVSYHEILRDPEGQAENLASFVDPFGDFAHENIEIATKSVRKKAYRSRIELPPGLRVHQLVN